MSQEELGFELGLDKSTICKYKLARRYINLRIAKQIADAFGVKLSDMLDYFLLAKKHHHKEVLFTLCRIMQNR